VAGLYRMMAIATLPYLSMLPLAHAQQLDLGHQPASGFNITAPIFLNVQPYHYAPAPPAAEPALYYRPDAPQYFPPDGGAIRSWSIFNPRY
jgi:hypothetical protein